MSPALNNRNARVCSWWEKELEDGNASLHNSQWGRPRGCPGEDVRGPHPLWGQAGHCHSDVSHSSQVRHQRQHLVGCGCLQGPPPPPIRVLNFPFNEGMGPFFFFCSFFSVEQSDSVIPMCTFHIPSHDGVSRYWGQFPVLHSRTCCLSILCTLVCFR